jgi:hypothetical protein
MSVSLYYKAKREHPISKQEQDACEKIAERYIADYPLGDIYEDFCIYDFAEPSEKNVIFEGATKLPLDEGGNHTLQVLNYWADCLQQIINILPHSQWYINIDDVDVTSNFDYPQ